MHASSLLESPLVLFGVLVCCVPLFIFFVLGLVKSFTRKTPGWIVVTVIAGLLGLACAIMAVGQLGLLVSKGISKNKEINKQVTTTDGLFSIKVPNGWSAQIQINPEADLAMGHMMWEQYLLLFAESKADLNMTLAEYARLTTEQTAGNLSEVTLGDLKPVQINGLPGMQRRFIGENEGVRAVFLHTSVETDDALCQILCWTLVSREKQAFPVYEKVLQTFEAKAGIASGMDAE